MILRISVAAFLNNEESAAAVEALKGDRLFLRSSIECHEGGIDAACIFLANHPTPALLIVESAAQGEALYKQLGALADVCAPGTQVILIGSQNDVDLYRTLIKEGVADYLIGPVSDSQIKTSIADLFSDKDVERTARLIAFAGVTGGVGSSVLSHNTAFELAKAYGDEVILVDLDLSYGTAALVFNLQPRQTIVDALTHTARLDEVLVEQYLVPYADKSSILASPASLGIGIRVTGESVEAVLGILKKMADFVVVDVPHAWEPWVSEVLAGADDLILVARPDLTNLRNAKTLVEYFGPMRGPDAPTRLVFNQVGAAKRSDLAAKDFTDALAKEPTISIPYDPEAFGRAINNGEMMSKASARSKATKAIEKLAKIVGAREPASKGGKKSAFSLFKK